MLHIVFMDLDKKSYQISFFIGLGAWQGKTAVAIRGDLLLIFKGPPATDAAGTVVSQASHHHRGKALLPASLCIAFPQEPPYGTGTDKKEETRTSPHTLHPCSHPHTARDHWPSHKAFCMTAPECGLTAGQCYPA